MLFRSNAMQRLGSSIAALTTSLVRAGHVFDFMESEMEEEITWFTAENGLKRKNINVQNGRDKAIDISNLHFSYNENDESRDKNKMRAQLNSKKMQISVGEKVMITGESGCTIESLMNGETIVINGKTGKITKEGGNAFGSVDLWAFPKLQTGRNDLAFSTNGARVIVRYSPMWL